MCGGGESAQSLLKCSKVKVQLIAHVHFAVGSTTIVYSAALPGCRYRHTTCKRNDNPLKTSIFSSRITVVCGFQLLPGCSPLELLIFHINTSSRARSTFQPTMHDVSDQSALCQKSTHQLRIQQNYKPSLESGLSSTQGKTPLITTDCLAHSRIGGDQHTKTDFPLITLLYLTELEDKHTHPAPLCIYTFISSHSSPLHTPPGDPSL